MSELPTWTRLIRVNPETGCWEWTGSRDSIGYGKSCGQGAHRRVYLRSGRTIPDGLELDHLCRNKLCVNPDHLEPVTRAENIRRRYLDYTHCRNGHEFTPENTYIRTGNAAGRRDCRVCIQQRSVQYRARRAA